MFEFKMGFTPKNKLEPNQSNYTLMQALSTAGEKVSVETAMTIPAFAAGIQVISESIGMLPFKLIHNFNGKSSPAYNRNEYKVLQVSANDYTTASQFRKVMTASYILFGDALAEKEYAMDGTIKYLHYIDSNRVSDIYVDKVSHRIRYIVDGKDLGRDKIFHLAGLYYNPTGYKGTSVLDYGREALGLALAQFRYASAYYGNGATPTTVIKTKAPMTKEQNENFLIGWNAKYKGAKKSNKTAILPDGIADLQVIGSDAEKSQLLQSRKESVIEICRLLRIPPHMVQDLERSTFSNIEEQAKGFISQTLMPHLINWEQSCNQQLLSDKDKDFNFYKFNLDSLERGKLLERYNAHNLAINGGWKSRNEIRDIEDLDKADGLDDFVRLGNLINNEESK